MNVFPIAIIGIVAALLAFDKRYKDGLIRHVSLAGIVMSCVIMVLTQWFGTAYDFPSEVKIFLWSCAIFISCHGYSFVMWKIRNGRAVWSKHVNEDE